MSRLTRADARLLLLPALALVAGVVWLVPGPSTDGVPRDEATPTAAPRGAAGRPNIVVVMTDDMRADDLRFMPSLRRLMSRQGVTFKNSFSPLPLCCPARASFLTGVYPHNHGVWTVKAPHGYGAFDDSATLGTALKAEGYQTGFIGKYLNGYGEHRSLISGRPSYRFVPPGWDDWRAALDNPGDPDLKGSTYRYNRTPFNVNGRVVTRHYGTYQTTAVGRMSRDMAGRFSDRAAPFFMVVNYVAPHHGGPREKDDPDPIVDAKGKRWKFVTPARPRWVRGRFDDKVRHAAGMPRDGGPAEADVSDKPRKWRRLPEPRARERIAMRELTRQRGESLYLVDRQLRQMVRNLKRSGEWSDTVFMFTSDNGYYQGEHRQRQGKINGHEPSLRVPFLVTGPGMRSGTDRYTPITTIDVTASILDLAGAEPPVPPDGTSRADLFTRGEAGWTVPVLHEVGSPRYRGEGAFAGARKVIGVRTARYSMLRYEGGENELYDLARDPAQDRNVWGSARYRDVRDDLVAVWTQLRDCAGDSCRAALPASLATDRSRTRELGKAYWRAIKRRYGASG